MRSSFEEARSSEDVLVGPEAHGNSQETAAPVSLVGTNASVRLRNAHFFSSGSDGTKVPAGFDKFQGDLRIEFT
jgi:hypothetical protein